MKYSGTPPNPTNTNMIATVDSGANIHLARQATATMALVTIENEMKARLPDGNTKESTHISTLHLPGIIKQMR